MEFRVLGPVDLWVADTRVDLGPMKQRTVLAALLVEPGRGVPPETLIGRVWDGSPPATVRNVMYTYVARLRRILAPAAALSGERVELRRRAPGGYRLDVDPDRVDMHRFRRLLGQARATPEGGDGERAALLESALGLWRGTPLAGLPGSWAERVRDGLRRQRLELLVEWADVEMRLGRPAAVIEELRAALVEHPLSEPLAGRLMRSLYQAGRGAEALECYAVARRRIVERVGAEPGLPLRRIHAAILREAPAQALAPVLAPAGCATTTP
jgi:DNA-binding SARP family transcriptional activator